MYSAAWRRGKRGGGGGGGVLVRWWWGGAGTARRACQTRLHSERGRGKQGSGQRVAHAALSAGGPSLRSACVSRQPACPVHTSVPPTHLCPVELCGALQEGPLEILAVHCRHSMARKVTHETGEAVGERTGKAVNPAKGRRQQAHALAGTLPPEGLQHTGGRPHRHALPAPLLLLAHGREAPPALEPQAALTLGPQVHQHQRLRADQPPVHMLAAALALQVKGASSTRDQWGRQACRAGQGGARRTCRHNSGPLLPSLPHTPNTPAPCRAACPAGARGCARCAPPRRTTGPAPAGAQ